MDPIKGPAWSDVIAAIAAALAAIAAAGAWVTSWFTKTKMSEIHILINSRLTELLKLTQESFFAAGRKEEKDKQAQFDAGAKSETDKKQ